MKIQRVLLLSLFCVASLTSCNENSNEISVLPSVEPFKNQAEVRFSSTLEYTTEDTIGYKMLVPYTDTYQVNFGSVVKSYTIFDEIGNEIEQSTKSFVTTELQKDSRIYVVLEVLKNHIIETTVKAVNHEAVLPYDVEFSHKPTDFKTTGAASRKATEIKYVKRPNATYVNSNNPELLTNADLNQALTRNNVTGEVFFTFEHNNGPTQAFYYGYQVKNVSKKNIYITIKNVGFQLNGPGSWLGEDEWIQFYNTKFNFDTSNWNEQQMKTFNDYYGFCNTYEPNLYQPQTIVLPPNEKIYVMGGTTYDSYLNFNAFNTANKLVNGGCSNGAVLFDVAGGTAQATFYVYTRYDLIAYETVHQGYVVERNGKNFGSQYIGYDTCNGIVDNEMVFEFDDSTIAQKLPVTFTNYYQYRVSYNGEPYAKINSTAHKQTLTAWTTHSNPQYNSTAVGTDMTRYITIDAVTKDEVVIDSNHYDGNGNIANIGNWMIDYQDRYNFVNKGDKDRKIVLSENDGGSIAVMIRDVTGKILDKKYTFTSVEKFPFNNEYYSYLYTLDVPAHSVIQIAMEYNLLANSNGGIRHTVNLI